MRHHRLGCMLELSSSLWSRVQKAEYLTLIFIGWLFHAQHCAGWWGHMMKQTLSLASVNLPLGRKNRWQSNAHSYTVSNGIITMNEAASVHCKAISLTWVMRNAFLDEVAQKLTAKWWSRSYPGTRKAVHQREQNVLKGLKCGSAFEESSGDHGVWVRPEEQVLLEATTWITLVNLTTDQWKPT